MPMHDWTLVPAGIYHAFHHNWISAISKALNAGLLPDEYYALPEQKTKKYGPDVLTLERQSSEYDDPPLAGGGSAVALRAAPSARFIAQTDEEYYRRKKSHIAVRHVSGDRTVAVIEIVSPGNKAGRLAFDEFVEKACGLLERRIHLLIVDPFPPGRQDPHGVHAAIWEALLGQSFEPPADEPLTVVAYECEEVTRAYIEPLAVGRELPEMPLFLEPNGCVMVPLEATYREAFAVMPRRWREVLEPAAGK
ncbi:MAG: DUF4058 family protein [Gemmataceae bacterium]